MGGEGTLRSPLPGIICPLFVSIIKRRRWRSITRVVTEQRATLCLSIPLNFLPFALPFLRHLPHGDMVNTSPLRLLDTASARSTSVPIQPLFSSLHFFLYRGRYGIDAANANRGQDRSVQGRQGRNPHPSPASRRPGWSFTDKRTWVSDTVLHRPNQVRPNYIYPFLCVAPSDVVTG